jgi:radical SAM protein with 4Fe4S-binding SPASM domain
LIQPKLLTLKSPLSIVYEVTPVCDYDCAFCYAVDGRQPSHPPLERVQAILDRLAQAEVCRLLFMGGEFFLHPAWEEILAYARQLGFGVSFISNGSKLTEKVCDRLKAYVQAGSISLHGPNAAVHDALTRRKGSFAQALRAMQSCQHSGIQLSVLYTPTRNTYRQVWDVARTLVAGGVSPRLINVSRLTPHGYALERWESIRLGLEHYLDIFEQAARIKKSFGLTVRVGDGFPRCQVPAEWRQFAGRCDAGVTLAAVSHQGNVKLCPNATESLGNLLHAPLCEIWTRDGPMSQLRELDWLPVQCKTCSSAPVCKSGCIVSQPNVEHFACDDIPPANQGLAVWQQPKKESQPDLPANDVTTHPIKESTTIVHPKFSQQYRIREDVPGTIIALESGGWFLVDSLGQAVVELCDGHRTREDLYRGVAELLQVAQDSVKERVNTVLNFLTQQGLCQEDSTECSASPQP